MSYGAEFLAEYAYEIDQAQREDVCGKCKWHRRYEHDKYWSCDNKDSEYYTDYTDYTDTCEEFEQRGVE